MLQVQKLREVLEAYCMHNPSLGYCQGMKTLINPRVVGSEAARGARGLLHAQPGPRLLSGHELHRRHVSACDAA